MTVHVTRSDGWIALNAGARLRCCAGLRHPVLELPYQSLLNGIAHPEDPAVLRHLDASTKPPVAFEFHDNTCAPWRDLFKKAGLEPPDCQGPEHILRRVSPTEAVEGIPLTAPLRGDDPGHAVFRDYWDTARSDAFYAACECPGAAWQQGQLILFAASKTCCCCLDYLTVSFGSA